MKREKNRNIQKDIRELRSRKSTPCLQKEGDGGSGSEIYKEKKLWERERKRETLSRVGPRKREKYKEKD